MTEQYRTPRLLNAVYLEYSCEYIDHWPCPKAARAKANDGLSRGDALERASVVLSWESSKLYQFPSPQILPLLHITYRFESKKSAPASIWRMACKIRQ